MYIASHKILNFIEGKNRNILDSDMLLLSGVLRELEVLGEAAGKVSIDTQKLFLLFTGNK